MDNLIQHIQETKKTFRGDLADKVIFLLALEHLYWACLASEQLLIDAAIAANGYSDKYTQTLFEYYTRHLDEEKGEIKILKKDLATAGVDMDVKVPFTASMDLIGSQYYLLKHVHPACLLGLLAVQEADPMEIEKVKVLEALHGKKLCRFLRLHAIKDLDHKGEVLELIEKAPDELKKKILLSVGNVLFQLQRFYC